MFPLFFSIVLSALFGFAAYSTYGLEAFLQSSWLNWVLSILITTGFLVSLMGELNDCLACKIKTRFTKVHWLETLCLHSPCIKRELNHMIHQ
jgi:hypothetical protein